MHTSNILTCCSLFCNFLFSSFSFLLSLSTWLLLIFIWLTSALSCSTCVDSWEFFISSVETFPSGCLSYKVKQGYALFTHKCITYTHTHTDTFYIIYTVCIYIYTCVHVCTYIHTKQYTIYIQVHACLWCMWYIYITHIHVCMVSRPIFMVVHQVEVSGICTYTNTGSPIMDKTILIVT